MAAITSTNVASIVAKANVTQEKATTAARAPSSLKAASKFTVAPKLNVSEADAMMVWTPLNNKFFETLSFLPPLSVEDTAKQVEYITRNGDTPCLEFSPPETAFTLDHGPSNLISSATSGYYDNRYWTMWKLPMFGCTDGSQVQGEIDACVRAFPGSYVRICGFNNLKQVQTSSFLVHRPAGAEAKDPSERSVQG